MRTLAQIAAASPGSLDGRIEAQFAHEVAALGNQVGGDHYKALAIQPVEYIHGNGIGFMEGCVIKYVTRWRAKGGVEDLRKAKHFLEMLIDLETGPGHADR